jgi:type II secretory pathway pseudopilin PulG
VTRSRIPDEELMHASGTRSPRHGFTLIEIVVLAAIVLIMAAITLPALGNFLDMENAKQARNQLYALQLSITNATAVGQNGLAGGGKTGFAQLVTASSSDIFPSRISQLVIPITTGDNRCKNATTVAYTGSGGTTNVGRWATNGPFFNQGIIKSITMTGGAFSGGLMTAIGTIRDTVVRTLPATANTVEFWLDSLDLQDAQNLDLIVDNVINPAAGNVWYAQVTVAGQTFYRLRAIFPITNNGCA